MATQYVSDVQLAERYAVNRCTIWRWSKQGILPKPVQLSENCTRWRLDLIERRDADLERESEAA
jgi:predicted DNA-binding transcriptional regulator AlpA